MRLVRTCLTLGVLIIGYCIALTGWITLEIRTASFIWGLGGVFVLIGLACLLGSTLADLWACFQEQTPVAVGAPTPPAPPTDPIAREEERAHAPSQHDVPPAVLRFGFDPIHCWFSEVREGEEGARWCLNQ